jgi:ubiquinone biosynthesis protein UbiJ
MNFFHPIKIWLSRTWARVGWCSQNALEKQINKIMLNQSELAVQLTALTTQVQHIGVETDTLKTKITDLETAINNGGTVSPEVESALNALKAQVQVVDDLVPDNVTSPTELASTTDPVTTQG